MILSFQEANNENENSNCSIKINEIEEILSKPKENETKSEESTEEIFSQTFSSQLIKIEEATTANNRLLSPTSTHNKISNHQGSSLLQNGVNLSRAEECIQKDVLHEIDHSSLAKSNNNFSSLNSNKEENSNSNNGSHDSLTHNKNYILKAKLIVKQNESEKEKSSSSNSSQINNNYFKSFINNKEENSEGSEDIETNIFRKDNIIKQNFNDNKMFKELSKSIEDDYIPKNTFRKFTYNDYYENNLSPLIKEIDIANSSPQNSKNSKNEFDKTSNSFYPNPTQSSFIYQRTPLLKPHKESKLNFEMMPLNEIISQCSYLCKSQFGCRFLQKKLCEYPKLASEYIYPVIKRNFAELSIEPFGNYFIQKLLELLTRDQLKEVISTYLSNFFMKICLNAHGTRVVQKLLDVIYKEEYLMYSFDQLFFPNLLELIINQNSTHIIIKYISVVKSPKNETIVNFLCENIFSISTHKHSCCTLQKCIEGVDKIQQKKRILMSIAYISENLFNDQFGNYITQFALSFNYQEINQIIINKYFIDFQRNFSQKFSSNVFQKCINHCDKDTQIKIIKFICNPLMVRSLLFDMYGNYVLQKTMQVSEEPYRSLFIEMVIPLLDSLQFFHFGSIVLHKLLLGFPELQKSYKRSSNGSKKINVQSNSSFFSPMRNQQFFRFGNIQNFNNITSLYS